MRSRAAQVRTPQLWRRRTGIETRQLAAEPPAGEMAFGLGGDAGALAEADGNRTRQRPCDLSPVLKTGESTRHSDASLVVREGRWSWRCRTKV